MVLRLISLILVLFGFHFALAQVDAAYTKQKDTALLIGEKVQEQLGFRSGFSITEIRGVSLISPRFEVSAKFRILSHFGNLIPNSLANQSSYFADVINVAGIDRPSIRARQLVYGDFKNGRWYILDLGLGIFNISGYTPELFRFWSARVALHESIHRSDISPQFEIGLTWRSRTEFVQPANLGLIYPPTFDASFGFHKEWNGRYYAAIDYKIDQALTSQKTAGIYNTSAIEPFKAPTIIIGSAEAGWHINDINSIFVRYADKVFRWPDDTNSMLWDYFEEGYLGRSYSFYWRGQW